MIKKDARGGPKGTKSSVQAFPLQWPDGWSRTSASRRESGHQFKQLDQVKGCRIGVTFAGARDALYEELRRLDARHVVISTNHRPGSDGVPIESRWTVPDDGVAVYFTLKGKPLTMACDRFDNAAANMRSLGLAIEAMRQLERHGGGAMMERAFAGFAALPPPRRSHWDVLGLDPGADTEAIERAFRVRARECHPDAGGSHGAMAELNAAREQALRAAGGGR
jgi:hypothetical protein